MLHTKILKEKGNVALPMLAVVDDEDYIWLVARMYATGEAAVFRHTGERLNLTTLDRGYSKEATPEFYTALNEKGEDIGNISHEYIHTLLHYVLIHGSLPDDRPL